MKLAEPNFDPYFKKILEDSMHDISCPSSEFNAELQNIRICLATLSELPIGLCELSADEKTFYFGLYIKASIPFDDLKNHIRSKNAFHEFRKLNSYEMEQEKSGHMQEYATYRFDNDGFIRYLNNKSKRPLRSFLEDNPEIVYSILKQALNS